MDNNEVTYEPPVLKFLTYLSDTSDKVNNIVIERINLLSTTLPSFPINLQSTLIFKKYDSLSNTKDFDNDLKKNIWNKTKEKQQISLEVQLVNSKNSDLFLSLKNL